MKSQDHLDQILESTAIIRQKDRPASQMNVRADVYVRENATCMHQLDWDKHSHSKAVSFQAHRMRLGNQSVNAMADRSMHYQNYSHKLHIINGELRETPLNHRW